MALWYTEMKRNLKRFKEVRKEIEVGKMSGAVGTFANIPPEIESYVCKHLGIDTALYQLKHFNVIVTLITCNFSVNCDIIRKICCRSSYFKN